MRGLAERQHGVFSTWQLLDHGISERTVHSRRAGGLLVPLHQGVYALARTRLDHEGRAMAAVLACGPGAVLSHFSAGHHWGLCGSYGPVEVLRQSGGLEPKGHEGVRLHQTRRLHRYEVIVERGLPVTV